MAFVKSLLSKTLWVGVGVGTCAILTKPNEDSFMPQMTMYELDPFNRLLIAGTLRPFTTFDDYVFFKMATVNYENNKIRCIGAFNKWSELKE